MDQALRISVVQLRPRAERDFESGRKLTKKTEAFIEMGFANRKKVSEYARRMGIRAPSEGGQGGAGSVECSLNEKGKGQRNLW